MESPNSALVDIGGARLSLPEAVYQAIRSAIFAGTLAPGRLLRQEELAKQFGVSRVPLREALQRLDADGLVVLRPRRGYAVMSLDPDEIVEIFELRMLVEERAGYLAALRRKPADIDRTRALLSKMNQLPDGDETFIAQWTNLNMAFHESLFAASYRRHLCRMATSLRAVVEPYIRMEVSLTGGLGEANAEHDQIMDAFARGDADQVARLSREHCEHTARRLIDGLNRKASPAARLDLDSFWPPRISRP
jgi:DNA-binding GntR family transcriptional regulator